MTPGPSEGGMGTPVIAMAATTAPRRRRMQPRRALFVMVGTAAVLGVVPAVVAHRMGLLARLSAEATTASGSSAVAERREPPACRARILGDLAQYALARE